MGAAHGEIEIVFCVQRFRAGTWFDGETWAQVVLGGMGSGLMLRGGVGEGMG